MAVETVRKSTRQAGIDTLLHTYNVQVLLAPSGPTVPKVEPITGDIWPNNWPGYGGHAAKTCLFEYNFM